MSLRRFREWVRVVIVPDWLLRGTLMGLLCISLIEWALRLSVPWLAHVAAPKLPESELYLIAIPPFHLLAVLFVSLLYGYYRVVFFHPLQRGYGTWLAQTPWQLSLPLPMGPIELVWQDMFVILAMMGFALLPPHADMSVWHIPAAVLFTYCATHIATLFRLGSYRSLFIAFLVAGLAILVGESLPAFMAVAAAGYGYVQFETRHALRDFPFTERRRRDLRLVPYEVLRPVEVSLPIAPTPEHGDGMRWMQILNQHALLVAAAVGFVFFSIAFQCRTDTKDFEIGLRYVHRLIAMVAIGYRTLGYLLGHWPPISIAGRIATRRWTIAGYDRMLLAPAAALVVATILPELSLAIGLPPLVVWPVSTTLTIWLCFGLPPTIEEWHYTGHYRVLSLVPNGRLQDFVQA